MLKISATSRSAMRGDGHPVASIFAPPAAAPGSAPSTNVERIVFHPHERLDAVLDVIRSARERLILSLFRCDDEDVLEALADAVRRNVRVEVLFTSRAKGWQQRLKRLWRQLENAGAMLYRYSGPASKYHAKYIVADDGPALIASLNLTRECFTQTCDFIVTTCDPGVVAGLKALFDMDCHAPDGTQPQGLSDRLIVGPGPARCQVSALLAHAQDSIKIIDPKLGDPAILTLLETKRAAGVEVTVLGRGDVGALRAHGKMLLVDDEIGVVGSLSASRASLDQRREVAVIVRDPELVGQLSRYFRAVGAGRLSVAVAARREIWRAASGSPPLALVSPNAIVGG